MVIWRIIYLQATGSGNIGSMEFRNGNIYLPAEGALFFGGERVQLHTSGFINSISSFDMKTKTEIPTATYTPAGTVSVAGYYDAPISVGGTFSGTAEVDGKSGSCSVYVSLSTGVRIPTSFSFSGTQAEIKAERAYIYSYHPSFKYHTRQMRFMNTEYSDGSDITVTAGEDD